MKKINLAEANEILKPQGYEIELDGEPVKEKMTEELERKILDEIEQMGVQTVYVDYRDLEYVGDTVSDCKTQEEFIDKLYEAYRDSIDDINYEVIKDLANKYNLSKDDEELQDLVFGNLEVAVDYDRFLNHEVKINIITSFYNDWNTEFTSNGWLRWLMHSQGFKVDSYPEIKALAEHRYLVPNGNGDPCYHDPNDVDGKLVSGTAKSDNKFIKSLYQEIVNMCIDESRTLVFLAKVTVADYFKIIEGRYKSISIKKDVMCGLYDYYAGGGSVLELDLQKDVKISKKNVYFIQLEGYNKRGYSVDDVYGLCGSAWKSDLVSFH